MDQTYYWVRTTIYRNIYEKGTITTEEYNKLTDLQKNDIKLFDTEQQALDFMRADNKSRQTTDVYSELIQRQAIGRIGRTEHKII